MDWNLDKLAEWWAMELLCTADSFASLHSVRPRPLLSQVRVLAPYRKQVHWLSNIYVTFDPIGFKEDDFQYRKLARAARLVSTH